MEWPQLRQPELEHLAANAAIIGAWMQQHWQTPPAVSAASSHGRKRR